MNNYVQKVCTDVIPLPWKCPFTSDVIHLQKFEHGINTLIFQCVEEWPKYMHVNYQDATVYNKKVTREEKELFDQPSYILFQYSNPYLASSSIAHPCSHSVVMPKLATDTTFLILTGQRPITTLLPNNILWKCQQCIIVAILDLVYILLFSSTLLLRPIVQKFWF